MTADGVASLADMAVPGAVLAVSVPPNARRAGVSLADGVIRIAVTDVPKDGRATEAARVALARAPGAAKTRLTLVRGAASRDKCFRTD